MPIHTCDGTISQSHQSSTFGIASDSANCCRIFICSTWSAIGCVRFCDLMVCCNMVLSHNNSTTLSHLSRKQHNVQTSAFNTFNIFKRLLFTTSRNAWTCTNGYDPWRHDGIAVAPTPPDSPTPTFHPCSLFQINKTQRGRLVLCNTHKSRTHVFFRHI